MHTTSTIRKTGSKYTVTFGHIGHRALMSEKFCESFEEAYRTACDYVNWELGIGIFNH
jgi:hypothetical protein